MSVNQQPYAFGSKSPKSSGECYIKVGGDPGDPGPSGPTLLLPSPPHTTAAASVYRTMKGEVL